jgi:sugar/nucleoside kinase (ribokinase family)
MAMAKRHLLEEPVRGRMRGFVRRSTSVMVVGDVMNDMIVRPEGPIATGSDNASRITRGPGGSAANLAAWLAALGVSVDFVGCVGEADIGEHRKALNQLGVRPHLFASGRRGTGVVVAISMPDGERTFFTERGANAYLEWSDKLAVLAARSSLIHVSGHSFFDPVTSRTARRLIRESFRAGATVSVDPGSTTHLELIGPDRFLRWTRHASLLFANRAEALLLAGSDSIEAASERLIANYQEVVVTLGADGAVALRRETGSGRSHARARPTRSQVVDGTGTGDGFVAGYLSQWLQSHRVAACLKAGTSVARMALKQVGARPHLGVQPSIGKV